MQTTAGSATAAPATSTPAARAEAPASAAAVSRPQDEVVIELNGLGARVGLVGATAFTSSAEEVVAFLNRHTPLTDWSVSRVVQSEQVHLHVHHDQVLATGDRVEWSQSFCSRMAAGAAHVVPNSRADSNYSDLSAAQDVGAYTGFVINDEDGEMFGVLCGVRPGPLRVEEVVDAALVELLSNLLSAQLRLSRRIDRERLALEFTQALAESDALTGLMNRRGWDRVVADAQIRIDAYGDPVAVAVVDLDGLKSVNDSEGHAAGDALLIRAAQALREALPPTATVARYGGDEFTILANDVTPALAPDFFGRLAQTLEAEGVAGSIGYAAAEPGVVSLTAAIRHADESMYLDKRRRKS